jgi:signal transduction histidine kinase
VSLEAAEEILRLDVAGFHAPGDDGESLVPVAMTDGARDLFQDTPRPERGESVAWQVYESGEPIVATDVTDHPEVQNPETAVRGEMLIPVGDHGVFIAAATEPNAFDETDRHLARILTSNLEHAIESTRRQRRLRERERELKRENERLEEVASIVSHDLRNPLNVIEGNLELAREECDSTALDSMASALDRSVDIIDDVLTFLRQGRSVDETEPIELASMVESCWANVETERAEVRVEGDLTFAGDPDRVRHVFENLFRNAVQHGGSGITIRVGSLGDGFFLADDGPGIPDSDRGEVFDAGYTTDENGTGLGLQIVAHIAEAHGWEVSVEGSESGGARFEITGVNSP